MRFLGIAVAAFVLASACTGPGLYTPRPGPYDTIPEEWSETLQQSRRDLEEGEGTRAYELLARLVDENPRILPVRVFLQEVELALLRSGKRAGRLSVPTPDHALDWLSNHYLTLAEGNPTPESLVLAARLASTPEKALELLGQAEALDPRCVWIPYARAWWNFTDYRFTPAEDSVREAFRLDSGHLPTMRLHAIVLTAAGETKGAINVLERWFERTRLDPLISPEERGEALLDLASLKILDGKPKEALRHLYDADPRVFENVVRLDEVYAAVHEARDRFDLAHEAIRRARENAPEDPLPLVQKAMLHAREGDEEAELETWRELLAHLDQDPEGGFSSLLHRLQALTRLQRAGQLEAGAPTGESADVPSP